MATEASSPLISWGVPSSSEKALAQLAEPVRRWFQARFGVPTLAQVLAWPALAQGDNLLLASPTGSGKTLAAFGAVFSSLVNEPGEVTRCLYLVPLKALAADARANLRRHVHDLGEYLPQDHRRIRIAARTGDTSTRLRRRLFRKPPDILITTPESLAVMLIHPAAKELFQDLRWLIVDEVHALAGSQRGADLALSLERLQALTPSGGDLRRIGLSATCAPLTTAAGFLVGVGRPCAIAEVTDASPVPYLKRRLNPALSWPVC